MTDTVTFQYTDLSRDSPCIVIHFLILLRA